MPERIDRRQVLQQIGAVSGSALLLQSIDSVQTSKLRADEKPPKTAKIKIGQIGTGHAHASKLSVYRESHDYEVVGIVEPNEQLRRRAEEHASFHNLPWMTQEQLLNVTGLQAVVIETQVRDLLDTAETCVSAGKHIHLDKPAGESLSQFKRILASAKKQNLLVQLGYMYRYNPGVLMLHEFLRNGWLGDIFEVHAVMSKVVSPEARIPLSEYPGGIMFELGCHILDLVIGVLGKPSSVTSFNQHASKIEDRLLDNMLAILDYSHATATVKSSAMEVEGFDRRHLLVCGDRGTLQVQPLDNPSVRLSLSENRGRFKQGTQVISLPKYTRYTEDAADMARIIRGEKGSDFSYEHDLMVQTALLQACGLPLEK